LLVGVGVISACPKVLNGFQTDVFEVNPLIVITSVALLSHQVLAFVSTMSSAKFKFSFDFLSFFHYLPRFFFVTTWEVG